MKAKSKIIYQVVQLTEELRTEPDQKTIRPLFTDLTAVEIKSSSLAVSTRSSRYDIPVGHWIMRDQRGSVSIVSDVVFQMNYQVVDD
jgi:hypothetical protein